MHWQTHTVFNQPAPLTNSNLFLSDRALCEAVSREGADWDAELLASIGQQLGTAESLELGRLANVNPPELLRFDASGTRLDDVRFHPAWHLLMQGLCANRVHNLAWGRGGAQRRICGPVGTLYPACAGGGRHALPDHHDPCRHAAAATGITARLPRLADAAPQRPL
ncbi:Putative acyl-CoA dehydrogenase AidB [Leclercia adecarboxylata]|uniref:Acyl-CoA dehydrogenase AidB n=1 Tax=Leclercia adecarboxylata TaxID=83655 RepID=A0A4V6YXT7_9ENTR|nr:Putative acyl-CoA dehydrogenase AidB [Leclercia adecarboxylata]